MINSFSNAVKAAGLSLFIGLNLGMAPIALAQSSPQASTKATSSQQTAAPNIRQGLPNRRAAAATRGSEDEYDFVVMAPSDTPWLSLSETPSLLVYVGESGEDRMLEVLIETADGEYVYDKFYVVPDQSGMFKVDLEGTQPGQQLSVGQDYIWQVSLISDPENRSSDRYAQGDFMRIASQDLVSTKGLDGKTLPSTPLERAEFFASLGLWQETALSLHDVLQTPNLSVSERGRAQQQWTALMESLELGGLGQQLLPQAPLTELVGYQGF